MCKYNESVFTTQVIIVCVVSVICLFLIVVIIVVVCNKLRSDKEVFDIALWKVAAHEISFPKSALVTRRQTIVSRRHGSNDSSTDNDVQQQQPQEPASGDGTKQGVFWGRCRGKQVGVKCCEIVHHFK